MPASARKKKIVQREGEEVALIRKLERALLPLLVWHRSVEREVVESNGKLHDPFLHPRIREPQGTSRSREPFEVVMRKACFVRVGAESVLRGAIPLRGVVHSFPTRRSSD